MALTVLFRQAIYSAARYEVAQRTGRCAVCHRRAPDDVLLACSACCDTYAPSNPPNDHAFPTGRGEKKKRRRHDASSNALCRIFLWGGRVGRFDIRFNDHAIAMVHRHCVDPVSEQQPWLCAAHMTDPERAAPIHRDGQLSRARPHTWRGDLS